jgi:predicted phage-related endonuclease
LSSTLELLIDELNGIKENVKGMETRQSIIENEIRAFLGEDESAIGERFKVSYKTSTTKRINNDCIKAANDGKVPDAYYKETVGRTLRISKIKKS